MVDGLQIRPIVAADQDEWRRLWTLYLEFYESRVSEEVYEASFARIICEHSDGAASFYEPRGLLALVDGKPVGLVHQSMSLCYEFTLKATAYATHTLPRFQNECMNLQESDRLYMYHRSCWETAQVCYLQDLFAVAEMRGTGIGRALIEAVYAQADRDGCPKVYWMTQTFNATARKLYDRIGNQTPFIKYRRFA